MSPLGALCPIPCVIFRNIFKLFTWVFDLFVLLDHCWPSSLLAFKLHKVRDSMCPVHRWISGSLKGVQHIIGTYQLSAGWLESLLSYWRMKGKGKRISGFFLKLADFPLLFILLKRR